MDEKKKAAVKELLEKAYGDFALLDKSSRKDGFERLRRRLKEQEGVTWEDVRSAYGDACEVVSISRFVDDSLRALLRANGETDDFYEKLWGFISESWLMESEVERHAAFGLALTDQRMPYEHLPISRMSDEEFHRAQLDMQDEIERLYKLSFRPFGQKTQEATAVLDVLDTQNDSAHKAVLLAAYLIFERKARTKDT